MLHDKFDGGKSCMSGEKSKRPWVLIHSENVRPLVCDETYSSKQLTGDEIAGMPVININEGTLKAGCRTGGDAHEDTEVYYVLDCAPGSSIHLDEDEIPCKPGDIFVIPPQVFHWIDNTKSDRPFVILTFWEREIQNGVFMVRKQAWGTSIGNIDPEYTKKRMGKNPD